MRKTVTLFFLSLGVALFIPLCSVFAQVPDLSPIPIPVPSQPETLPVPVPMPMPVPVPVPVPKPTQFRHLVSALTPVNVATICSSSYNCLGWDEQIWGDNGKGGDSKALLAAIDNSLYYLTTNKAATVYRNYPIRGITLERVRRSLLRFRQLVVSCDSPAQLQAAIRQEFVFYQSAGNDHNGNVKFTAYYEPVYTASRVRTPVYQYPIYRRPPDFERWAKPHPKRVDLEGKDGLLGDRSRLRGLELFWFANRFDAYMIQIQGSAQLNLTDGTTTSVGYGGATDYPWTSIGKELAKDGKLPLSGLTLPIMTQYFQQNPNQMDIYLPRWKRFVFFQETGAAGAKGSILVPVTAERSIATDKSIMPPGALALINTSLPFPTEYGQMVPRTVSRYVLDQDAGSAIKGPGRVDYFMGTGKLAGDRAGITGGNGKLYYLLLKQ